MESHLSKKKYSNAQTVVRRAELQRTKLQSHSEYLPSGLSIRVEIWGYDFSVNSVRLGAHLRSSYDLDILSYSFPTFL